MIKSKFLAVAFFATLLVGVTGCESLVEDINNDPNNFTEVTLPLALGQAGLGVAAVSNQHTARIAAMWSDQFTGTDRQYISVNNYNVDASDFDPVWEDIYQRALPAAQNAKALAAEQGASVPQGVATIFEAYYFGEAAALFGDVPFTQANDIAQFPDPAYDGQMDVLRGAVALLDEALGLVGDVSVEGVLGNVYTSDATWKQIANGLKARYLMLLKDYDGAFAAASAANVTSFGESFAIKASTANYGENLYWQFEVEQRSDYLSVGDSKFRLLLSDTMPDNRSNAKTNDVARYNYFVAPGLTNGLAKYNTTDGFAAISAPMYVMPATEIQLMLAESALRKSSPDAAAALAALNVARNMWDEVLGGDSYTDYELADFESAGIAGRAGESANAALLYEIVEEKFLSVIGLPAFYDMNRTNNLLGVTPDIQGVPGVPQRYVYPSSERASNSSLGATLPDLYAPTPANM